LNYLSFLVDDLPLHYYQSELLLFSLEKFTSFNKNNILIHCTSRVNEDFLLFLRENDYLYKVVEPYLDGKYCNKLQQLSSFKNLNDEDGVFLVDADTFFLADPIVTNLNKIGGKVVDAPNPPLSVLSKIFTKAGLSFPKIVQSDWVMENAYTFECNFNGGFYYVPAKYVQKADELWKKWATWLYEYRVELFDTKKQQIHVDQVSFAMMVKEANFDYEVLVSNNNSPIHYKDQQRLFDKDQEVSMLHYHRSLNYFGLLSKDLYINDIIDRAIDKANRAIVGKRDFRFYKQFNRSFVKFPKRTEKTELFKQKIEKLTLGSGLKLILHGGTPKTGTTSLQFLLDEKYNELLEQGILYPKYYLNTNPPKHQWLIPLLRQNKFDEILLYLEKIVKETQAKNLKTIFLSTEGIFNHWWDFSPEAKEVLKVMAKEFDFKLLIVFREPKSFLESFYKQNLKNPQNSAAVCYGKDISFEEMLKDKWFVKHIDYLGFIQECEMLFGEQNISVFEYSGDVNERVLKKLNVVLSKNQEERRENIGQSHIGVELLKVVNRFNLNTKDKKSVVKILKEMDHILDVYSKTSFLNQDIKSTIDNFFLLESKVLEEYNVRILNYKN